MPNRARDGMKEGISWLEGRDGCGRNAQSGTRWNESGAGCGAGCAGYASQCPIGHEME